MRAYRLDELLEGLGPDERGRLEENWGGGANGRPGEGADPEELRRRMLEPGRIRECWSLLADGERSLLRLLLERRDRCLPYRRIVESGASRGRTGIEVEEEIRTLERRGLLFRVEDGKVDRFAEPALTLAEEVAEILESCEEASPPEVREEAGPFTLKEHLGRRRALREERDKLNGRAAQHARQAYKLFLMPNAVLARIRRLPGVLREVVELAMVRYGGLLPRSLCLKTLGDDSAFEFPGLKNVLEEGLVGTVGHLDLRECGIRVHEETLCVFQEVNLVYLRAEAETGPPKPSTERVAGVDLATNVMRFLRYLDENGVRYTIKGEIFRATHKRILNQLLGGEGGEVEAFRFIYKFCLHRRLIECTGERTFRLSEGGRAFEERELPEKLRDLLTFAIEDPGCGGDPFHQLKLRRLLLRLLRRLEPGVWYDAMYLPFLARNSWLTQIHEPVVKAYYASCREKGRHPALENLQELAWNLFHWVRSRLHLLGIVDLGFEDGRPVALRLSQLGAGLLAAVPQKAVEGRRSSLVVNPDFEILCFPEGDSPKLVHSLDRFARRTASDRLFRFQITEDSVRSALADGMGMKEIMDLLSERCRTPLPQNVLFSLRDWGDRAGVLRLDPGGVLSSRKKETLERLRKNARIRELTRPVKGGLCLRGDVKLEDFRALLRDLGFHLEQG